MDSKTLQALTKHAFAAQQHAHAPYSRFNVGAALITEDGEIFTGCNVENAAYPLGQCAEATAIGSMVAGGQRTIKAIVIASPNDEPCYPCGGCRQKIAEFAGDDVPVYMATQLGEPEHASVGDLLPRAFRYQAK